MAQERTLTVLTLLALALLGSQGAKAQVAPSVTGQEAHLWAGAEFSRFQSDYHVFPVPGAIVAPNNGNDHLPGIGIYGNLDIYRRYSLEAEARFLDLADHNGETEKTFLLGPSARLYRRHKLSLNAKFLAGIGLIHYPFNIGYGSYFAFAPGGNIEYRLSRHLKARAEYEYVFEPSAPGLPGQPSNGVDPHGFSIGVAYRIF